MIMRSPYNLNECALANNPLIKIFLSLTMYAIKVKNWNIIFRPKYYKRKKAVIYKTEAKWQVPFKFFLNIHS